MIQKYTLHITDDIYIHMPHNAVILDIQEQDGSIVMWVDVDPNESIMMRHLKCRDTGMDSPHDAVYVATVQHEGFVWHFFDGGILK